MKKHLPKALLMGGGDTYLYAGSADNNDGRRSTSQSQNDLC